MFEKLIKSLLLIEISKLASFILTFISIIICNITFIITNYIEKIL